MLATAHGAKIIERAVDRQQDSSLPANPRSRASAQALEPGTAAREFGASPRRCKAPEEQLVTSAADRERSPAAPAKTWTPTTYTGHASLDSCTQHEVRRTGH